MNVLFVLNPVSGVVRTKEKEDLLVQIKRDSSFLSFCKSKSFSSVDSWKTVNTEEGLAWSLKFKKIVQTENIALVVAIGGDGTFRQVTNAIKDLPGVLFLPIPGGRGNDWIKTLFPGKPLLAERLQKPPRLIDVSSVVLDDKQEEFFINMASVGYGGEVVQKIERTSKLLKRLGLIYQIQGALTYFSHPSSNAQVIIDGQKKYTEEVFAIFVGGGQANANGLYWLPQASLEDKKVSWVHFDKPGFKEMVLSLSLLKRKESPVFQAYSGTSNSFEVGFSTPIPIELDGEFIGQFSKFYFKTAMGRLSVL